MTRKLPVAVIIAAATFLILAAPAFAQTENGDVIDQPALAFPAVGALLAWGISSVLIPYITAFVADADAPDWVTSGIAALLAGLTAIAAYFADVPGIPDWKYALGLFGLTVLGAVGFREGIEPTGATRRDSPHSLYGRGLHVGAAAGSGSASPGQGRAKGRPTVPPAA